nr:hypothetical protein [Amycolatopsis sp. RTGN1]
MSGVFVPGAVNQIVVGRDGHWTAGGITGRSFAVSGDGGRRGRRRVGGCDGDVRVGIGAAYVRVGCLLRLAADGADGLQQAWSDLSPADKQERADGVEGGFTVGAGEEWVGDVEGEGGEAGEGE